MGDGFWSINSGCLWRFKSEAKGASELIFGVSRNGFRFVAAMKNEKVIAEIQINANEKLLSLGTVSSFIEETRLLFW